jgi:uncharacterized protein YuzE
MVKVTFDRSANAAYIALKSIEPGEAALQHLIEADGTRGTITLDFDTKGRLIGIEVLDATHALPEDALKGAERT